MSLWVMRSRETTEEGESLPKTIAVRQEWEGKTRTPVLVVEADDGTITVHVIPNVWVKTVDRTVDL